jgi:hypothetical protein
LKDPDLLRPVAGDSETCPRICSRARPPKCCTGTSALLSAVQVPRAGERNGEEKNRERNLPRPQKVVHTEWAVKGMVLGEILWCVDGKRGRGSSNKAVQ